MVRKYRAFLKSWNRVVDVAVIDFKDKTITWIHYDVWTKEEIREVEPFDDVELMEFTGLLDNNDNEIYEKDIAFDILSREFGEIIAEDCTYYFKRGSWYELLNETNHCIEVIGNIYENQDLLGGN